MTREDLENIVATSILLNLTEQEKMDMLIQSIKQQPLFKDENALLDAAETLTDINTYQHKWW